MKECENLNSMSAHLNEQVVLQQAFSQPTLNTLDPAMWEGQRIQIQTPPSPPTQPHTRPGVPAHPPVQAHSRCCWHPHSQTQQTRPMRGVVAAAVLAAAPSSVGVMGSCW